MGQGLLKGCGRDGSVGGQDTKHGGHVGVNHACTLGHAGQTVGAARGKGKGLCAELWEGIGGADGLGGGGPGLVSSSKGGGSLRDTLEDGLDRKILANDTSGHDEGARACGGGRGLPGHGTIKSLGHVKGIPFTLSTGDGVGTA